jgi:hypothetical protein
VVLPPAATPVADRQERPQSFPLGIRETTSRHVYVNYMDSKQSHDRMGKS